MECAVIKKSLLGGVCGCILTIPVFVTARPDVWIWHYTMNGMFSIESACRLFMDCCGFESKSTWEKEAKWWKMFWGLNIPNKIKLLMWKFFNIIPSNHNLNKRGIQIHPGV